MTLALAVTQPSPVSRLGHNVLSLVRVTNAGQVRGVLAERVVVSTPLDPFLSLRALASYSGFSVRKLREYLDDSAHPLPCYRVGGKILVRRSEFDAWITRYRQQGRADVAAIVADVFNGLSKQP
jgi:hypothetical protein